MVTPPTTEDKARSYVPQIRAAYEKVINASRGSLNYAIEAGELLNSAKQAMATKGGWPEPSGSGSGSGTQNQNPRPQRRS
jgi:hypothetical protein